MTFVEVLTLMFTTGNAVGMFLATQKNPYGWLVTAFAQATMGTYLLVTQQWWGIAQFVCLVIALNGLWSWTRQTPKKKEEVAPMADREL